MILQEIHISGFGIFHDVSNKFRNGINVIYGPNEAGKSTLLKFIRYVLFGYKPREVRMEALSGGKLGGTARVKMSSGEVLSLERKENKLSVYKNDLPLNDTGIWSRMLNDANDNLFRNIYAFSLEDLNDTGSFRESAIEDRIFSISTGLGNISIGDTSDAIRDKADLIYKPSGRIQQIPQILNAIEQHEEALRLLTESLDSYNELQRNLTEITDESSLLSMEINEKSDTKNKLDKYLRCYPGFLKISDIDEELSRLLKPECPQGGLEQLNELEKEEGGHLDSIKKLNKGTGDEKGIIELEAEYNSLNFRDALVAQVKDADYIRDNLELFRQTLTEKQTLEQQIESFNAEISRSLKSIGIKWTEQNVADLDEALVCQNRINSFRDGFSVIGIKRLQKETLINASSAGRRVVNAGNLINLGSFLFLLAAIPLFIYNLPAGWISCLGAAVILIACKRFIIIQDPLKNLSEDLRNIAEEENALKKEYKKYLREVLHLNEELTPEAAIGAINIVSGLKKVIIDRDNASATLKKKNDLITIFEAHIVKFDGILELAHADSIQRANQILKEFAVDQGISVSKANLLSEINKKKKNLKLAEEKLTEAGNKIRDLLSAAQSTDRKEFKQKYELISRIAALESARKTEVLTIEAVAGRGISGEVIEYLKNKRKDLIEQEIEQINPELARMNEELKNKNEQTGSLKLRIKQIEGQSSVAELMTAIETEKKKLEIEYHNWLSYKLAFTVLSDVRRQFEKEKQPEVIRNSSSLFSKITNGNFKRIGVSMDRKEVTVFDATDAGRGLGELSRGTREQLLLAMRLGFIEEYEKTCEPLPLVVDEIFVNFDTERTKKTAEIFSDFAKDRQIIIFTCHPDTAGYFIKSGINLINL
ncbi:MAG TPA: AAA family ATPase [Bacteroidales bacterium]|nr:AAA family ATPase [Bacteroidales bacterium]